jgi:hypothetical protein
MRLAKIVREVRFISFLLLVAALIAVSCPGGRPAERVKVLLTLLDGREVFRDPSFAIH